MDTNEQEPVVGADVTPPADTSANITQPAETGEVSTTDPNEAGQAEAPLLAGKYKSAEELEKAYQEIQQLNGQLSQKAQLANMLEKQTGLNAQQISELIARQEEQQRQQLLASDPTILLRQENEQLKAEKALQAVNHEIDNLIRENPVYEAHREKILKLAFTPGIGYDPETLEDLASVQDLASEWIGGAIAEGQRTAYNKIDTKLMSQSTPVQSTEKKSISPEDMKNMSTEELRKILPSAPRD